MGVFPAKVSPLDWILVDIFAAAISGAARSQHDGMEIKAINAVHPKPVSWSMLIQTLNSFYRLELKEVSLPQWLDHLQEQAGSTSSSSLTSLKIYEFFRSLADGREDNMSCEMAQATMVLGSVVPITEALLADWLQTGT